MKLFLVAVSLLVLNNLAAQKNYLIVGTYDSPKSEGIYVYSFDEENGKAKEISHIKTSNPSFLTISRDQRFVYAVAENAARDGRAGEVNAFSFDKTSGKLTFINKQESGGDHPCHVELDHTGKWLFVSNYTSGTISTLPVNENGSLGKGTAIQHTGSGPNVERQKSAHAHGAFISSDNKMLYVTDLGIDKLMRYNFDKENGQLTPSNPAFLASVAGSGPRQMAQHSHHQYTYVIEELSGTVQVYKKYKNAKLKAIQRISTMPKDDEQFAGSADIHLSSDARFLYASNRGDANSIAIFKVRNNGKLKLIAHQSTLGKSPRNFTIDPSGNFLLVGNQNSEEIVIFKRNKKTGLLTDSGNRIKVGKPVCLKWISYN